MMNPAAAYEITVPSAMPTTPQCSTLTNTRSRAKFRKQATASAYSGRWESPLLRRMAEPKL